MSDRDRILDAALAAAHEVGWSELALEDISARTDISAEEILRLYPTRAHVARSIIARVLDRLPAELADELTERSTLRDRLYSCLAHVLRSLERHKDFVRAMSRDTLRVPDAGAMQIPLVMRYVDLIAEQVEHARERGEISRFVIPHFAAPAFWLITLRIIHFWLGDISDISEKTHALADRWVTGFVRKLGAPSPSGELHAEP